MTTWRWNATWRRDVLAAADGALDRAGEIVEAGAKRRCPVSEDGSHGRPPGFLRDSIGRRRTTSGGPSVEVYASAGYALPVELGAKPHVIVSHGNYPLRAADGRVFGRRVQHPGNPPQPFLRPALDDLAGRRL